MAEARYAMQYNSLIDAALSLDVVSWLLAIGCRSCTCSALEEQRGRKKRRHQVQVRNVSLHLTAVFAPQNELGPKIHADLRPSCECDR